MNGGMHQNESESTDRHRQGSRAAATGESAKSFVGSAAEHELSSEVRTSCSTEPVGTIGIRLEEDKVYELNYKRP